MSKHTAKNRTELELKDALARVAELEKALDAEKKQSAFYDLQAQRIMVQRDAAESRASAAEKRLDELESTRCANCGKPNPTIVGGELTDGEAVCSNRCYDQLSELGCPHERHVGYRHPAETEELLSARARVSELEREDRIRACQCGDDDACALVVRAEEAESRASAAVEAHAQLLSRIAADGTLDAMERAVAAEQRVRELEQTREHLREDWYAEQRRRDAAEQRVAELEAALAAAESAYSEAIAGALDQRDAAEKRVAELEAQLTESAGALDLLDLYEGRRLEAGQRVSRLEVALDALLDAAERQAAGFPLGSEEWFAVRDFARARLPAPAPAPSAEDDEEPPAPSPNPNQCRARDANGFQCMKLRDHGGEHNSLIGGPWAVRRTGEAPHG